MNDAIQPQEIRPMAVAGQFYPGNKQDLTEMLKGFFENAKPLENNHEVQALIVPHAGYVFSGEVAAKAYAQIPRNKKYDHIFLIGPSHHTYLDGASVCTAFRYYQTPLGEIPVALDVCRTLVEQHDCLCYKEEAHTHEHCLEVQLPFLQYHLHEIAPIVPIIIGTQDIDMLERIAHALKPYFNSRNLFVISSDFSHYPSYEDAEKADKLTGEGVMGGTLNGFVDALVKNHREAYHNLATSACGQSAIAVLLILSQQEGTLTMQHLAYANSGDSPYGGKDQVVGYHAFALVREDGFSLNEEEKMTLLALARNTIKARLGLETDESGKIPESLHRKVGAFVTLTKGGRLRGCIGHFGEDMPLCEVVKEMAVEAAFQDPRFPAVSADELDDIRIEISVLTPLKRINDIKDFCLHRDGIYIRKGNRGGTFLPQVADETNWTKEEFLGHCAQDKAGLGWNGWRNAELYTYRAIIFHE